MGFGRHTKQKSKHVNIASKNSNTRDKSGDTRVFSDIVEVENRIQASCALTARKDYYLKCKPPKDNTNKTSGNVKVSCTTANGKDGLVFGRNPSSSYTNATETGITIERYWLEKECIIQEDLNNTSDDHYFVSNGCTCVSGYDDDHKCTSTLDDDGKEKITCDNLTEDVPTDDKWYNNDDVEKPLSNVGPWYYWGVNSCTSQSDGTWVCSNAVLADEKPAFTVTKIPDPNECHPSKGCNVCTACCEEYIPAGDDCDTCVASECT